MHDQLIPAPNLGNAIIAPALRHTDCDVVIRRDEFAVEDVHFMLVEDDETIAFHAGVLR